MGLDDLMRANLGTFSQDNTATSGTFRTRNVYPAEVVNANDPTEQGRITARILSLDENNKISGGRDRNVSTEQLVICQRLMPQFFFVMPSKGEMVYVIMENPEDNSAPRYWMGPIITSKPQLKFQSYPEANKTFDITKFYSNQNTINKTDAEKLFPRPSDVAIQGRDDADLILKSREAILIAGKFIPETLDENTENPGKFQIKQFVKSDIKLFITSKDKEKIEKDLLPSFSQSNLISTNINLYSPRGKFRNPSEMLTYESNKDLKSFGELANTLHPVVFGDELIKLLDLIINVVLNHIHTPQKPLVTTSDSDKLSEYRLPSSGEGLIHGLVSNHIRVN